MTIFEYVSAFVSIVLGLAVADLLVSVHRLLRARRTIRWDWLTPVCAFIVLLRLVAFWWGSFEPGQKEMTVGAFLPHLFELILLFLLSAAALPDADETEGVDLRRYYEDNRVYFWSLFCAAFAWDELRAVGVAVFQGGGAWAGVILHRLPDLVVLSLFASLIVVRRRWWHGVVVVIALTGPLAWLSRSLG